MDRLIDRLEKSPEAHEELPGISEGFNNTTVWRYPAPDFIDFHITYERHAEGFGQGLQDYYVRANKVTEELDLIIEDGEREQVVSEEEAYEMYEGTEWAYNLYYILEDLHSLLFID